MKLYANGMGATTGDTLATSKPYQTTGNVYYVSSSTGNDAVATLGLQRSFPLATLAAAITGASDYDDIVLLSGHAETLSAAQTIAKRVRIIGEGVFGSASMPTFTRHVNGRLFDITVSRVQLRGIRFASGTTSTSSHKVGVGGTDVRIRGCYFEAGANDGGAQVGLLSGSDRVSIESSTLISTPAAGATLPNCAVLSAAALADVRILDCTVDGGPGGWSGDYAVDLSGGALTAVQIESLSLLRDSDLKFHATTSGFVSLGTCSGSARVVHA